MRRLLLAAVVTVTLGFLSGTARAAVPTADARAYEVLNASTGEVIAAHNAHERLPMASLTKLMTVIVAMKHLQPDQIVTVSKRTVHVGGSTIPLRAGEKISVEDLLRGALIQSANDAADTLADAASNGDLPLFISWMNERAQQLGLDDTHFVRADGLDAPGHVSSAHDIGVLAQIAMHSPLVRSIVRERSATIENGRFTVHTWNDLLGVFPGLIGVKTGHTDNAGWCEVAAARRQGYTIYAVILGSPGRAQRNADLRRLLAWGVAQYRALTLVRSTAYAHARLGYGRPALALVAMKPLVHVVPAKSRVVERIVAPSAVRLPVELGQKLGTIEIRVDGQLVGVRPLVAARSVARPGLGGRLRWYATRTVHDFLGLFS
jgi:serine-type D-Ala-D-Ala carboxypeptidase (penicillin-binding protein 5/6)